MESGNKKKAAQSSGGGGKFVWLIYHKSGRCDAQLMGVYTGARTALKNAKAVIERETGGAEKRMKEEADLSDFSPNIQVVQMRVGQHFYSTLIMKLWTRSQEPLELSMREKLLLFAGT